jgi:hypothetical protein
MSFWFCAIGLVLPVTIAAQLRAADIPPPQILEALLSPDTPDEEWHKAENSFQKLPPEVGIRTLYPEIAKGIPGGMAYATYNCSDPDRDRHIGGWGRYCVANWLWCKAISCGRGNAKVSPTLLALWKQPQSAYGQRMLLSALDYSNWIPEAEEPVRKLFTDAEADSGLRAQAAACLLHHFGTKYHHEVVALALFSPHEVRGGLFRELVSLPHAHLSGVDPKVVRMGFWLMFEEMARTEERFAHDGTARGSYYGAFLFAKNLETYLGGKFTPDYGLPKYQAEQDKETWYRETTENAFAWWLKSKDHYAD